MDEKELRIISEISKNGNLTQRELSQRVGLSLGAINITLSRLIRKGYIKVRNLNKKKVQYLITPKGTAEKNQQSYCYMIRTVSLVKELVGEEKLKEVV